MSRRPYIETKNIKEELRPTNNRSDRPDGYLRGALGTEVVGMDGRNDWFRCRCRNCERQMITRRNERSSRYFMCECGTWHHQNKGFFNVDRFDTEPLKPSEVEGDLYKATTVENKWGERSTFYGSKEYIESRNPDYFEIDTIERVKDSRPAKPEVER